MPYFTVDQLLELSFGVGNILPESVKAMLVELESNLEITDVPIEPVKEYRSFDSKRESSHAPLAKYRNRYDFDNSSGKDRDRNRDRKKKDFRHSSDAGREETSAAVDSTWEAIRTFKPTKIESKTGIEKTVNDLRIALNKISASNYDKQRDIVMGLVNDYFESGEQSEQDTCRISKAIFDIASANKFYSEMYAKLYKELTDAHSIFAELLRELLDKFIGLDAVPVYADPDVDYDGFCEYLKACESRKTTSTFIVNCLKLGLVESSEVAKILSAFVKYVDDNGEKEEFSKCIEGVIENIYIIATSCSKELAKTDKWSNYILLKLHEFAKPKGEMPGISNRSKFKFMDILDKI